MVQKNSVSSRVWSLARQKKEANNILKRLASNNKRDTYNILDKLG